MQIGAGGTAGTFSNMHHFWQSVLVASDMVVDGVVGHEDTTLYPPSP